jgi:hypothetical protein
MGLKLPPRAPSTGEPVMAREKERKRGVKIRRKNKIKGKRHMG